MHPDWLHIFLIRCFRASTRPGVAEPSATRGTDQRRDLRPARLPGRDANGPEHVAGEAGALVVPAGAGLVAAAPVQPSARRGRAGGLAGGVASRRVISGTVSGIIPGSAGGGWSGLAGGGAWVSVRSRSKAAVTAQMARAAMTRTVWRAIACVEADLGLVEAEAVLAQFESILLPASAARRRGSAGPCSPAGLRARSSSERPARRCPGGGGSAGGAAGRRWPASAQAYQRWPLEPVPAERTSQRRVSLSRRVTACAHVSVTPRASVRRKLEGTRSTYPWPALFAELAQLGAVAIDLVPADEIEAGRRQRTPRCRCRWRAAPWCGTPDRPAGP